MALNKPLEMYRSHSNDFYHNDKIGVVENTNVGDYFQSISVNTSIFKARFNPS